MNSTIRNMTLTAAALAALTLGAPKAVAQEHGRRERGGGQRQGAQAPRQNQGPRQSQSPRQNQAPRSFQSPRPETHAYGGNRGYNNYGYRGYGADRGYRNYGSRYVGPVRPYVRGFASPFRIFSGFRFYNAYPGAGYVYIANYGWVLPPFFGAVWVPGTYDIDGLWVEGYWR